MPRGSYSLNQSNRRRTTRRTLKTSNISSPVSDKITKDIERFTNEFQTNMKIYLDKMEEYKKKVIEYKAYLEYRNNPTLNKNSKYLYAIPRPKEPKLKPTRPILPPETSKKLSHFAKNNFNNNDDFPEEETND